MLRRLNWTLFSISLSFAAAAGEPPSFQIVDLTPAVGESSVTAIAGDFVLGYSQNRGDWLYKMDGTVTWIPHPDARPVSATAVNENGVVVGGIEMDDALRVFQFAEGNFKILPIPGSRAHAFAINASGQIAGDADGVAFIFSNGEVSSLGTFGGRFSHSAAINAVGEVVGHAETSDPPRPFHPFVYRNQQLMDLGTYGGDLQGYATGINNQGVVVGYSNSNPFHLPPDRAVLFDDSGAHDLGLLPGYPGARPLAINDRGDVVGEAQGFDSRNRAAFLVTGGTMWNLNDLAPSSLNLVQAVGISATGIIAGTAITGGHVSAFLAVPIVVPEHQD